MLIDIYVMLSNILRECFPNSFYLSFSNVIHFVIYWLIRVILVYINNQKLQCLFSRCLPLLYFQKHKSFERYSWNWFWDGIFFCFREDWILFLLIRWSLYISLEALKFDLQENSLILVRLKEIDYLLSDLPLSWHIQWNKKSHF